MQKQTHDKILKLEKQINRVETILLVTTGALNEILRKRLGLDELDVNIEGGFKSMVGRRKFLHKDYKGLERFVNERMPEIIDA